MQPDLRKKAIALICAGILIAVVALYARTAYYPFYVVDDGDYVINNPYVTSGLSFASFKWAFTAFHSSNWHPLTWLSLMIDSQLFGTAPMGYHLFNVALHAANSALLFLLLNLMTGAMGRSAFVAACFALHPLHVESVVWITERKDVLSALFWILTLLCYSVYVRKARPRLYLLTLSVFGLGLMAKPMLVTLPLVMLLLDFWPLQRWKDQTDAEARMSRAPGRGNQYLSLTAIILEKIPFLLLSAISSIVTIFAQGTNHSIAALKEYPLAMRVENALWSMFMYTRKMIVPVDLAAYYPLVPVPTWKSLTALLFVSVMLYAAFRCRQKYPWLTIGWLWYGITLLPVIGLVQVADQAMADRYSYLPLIGLFILISWGGGEFYVRLPKLRMAVVVTAGGALLLCAVTAWHQTGYWQDNVRLIRHSMAVTTESFFVYRILGGAYEQQGLLDSAEQAYRRALQFHPNDPGTRTNLGNILDRLGRPAEALRQYEEAILLSPHYILGHYNMGITLEELSRWEEALLEYYETLKIMPDFLESHNGIGRCLYYLGMYEEAIQEFNSELRVHPGLQSARNNLELALQQRKRVADSAGRGQTAAPAQF